MNQYCPLPITHPARAYTKADHTNIADTFEQFEPILVCDVSISIKQHQIDRTEEALHAHA